LKFKIFHERTLLQLLVLFLRATLSTRFSTY